MTLSIVLAGLVLAAPRLHAQSSSVTTAPQPPAGSMAPSTPANQPRPSTGTGIVIGRVVDMSTGRPVSGAVVTIGSTNISTSITTFTGGPSATTMTPSALDGSSRPSDVRVLTDNQGRFAFLDLPKGGVQFGVIAGGYIGGGYGQRRPTGAPQPLELGDGQRVTDVTLPVWKYGAVSGTITDESGEPVVGIPVAVLRWQILGGRRRLGPSGQSGATDDRGVYRIGMLVPGDYVVAVALPQLSKPLTVIDEGRGVQPTTLPALVARAIDPSTLPGSPGAQLAGNAVLTIGRGVIPPAAPPTGRIWTYQSVFYPAARGPAEATTVTVGAGEERGNVDVQLRLGPTSRVSGVISGSAGPAAHVVLHLLPMGLDDLAADIAFETASTMSDASGAFSLVGVPPGQYMIRASFVPGSEVPVGSGPRVPAGPSAPPSPSALFFCTNTPVTVGDDDVQNLAVTMRLGARLSGSLHFDGTKERPLPDTIKILTLTVALADARAVSALNTTSPRAPFDANGQATTGGLAPGRYLVTAGAPAGWTFKAALFNGRDISTQPLDIESTDISGVVFVMTDRTSEIAGTVQNASGNDADATVLLFPADERVWTDSGTGTRRFKTMRTNKTGGFLLTAIPEGDYYIVAVRDDVVDQWPDPKFLASLRGSATRVSIVDGDRKSMNLRTAR